MKSAVNKLTGDIICLDIGAARTGVARINVFARIAEPLAPIDMRESSLAVELSQILSKYQTTYVVAGLPRGLDGQHTSQTTFVEEIVDQLKVELPTIQIFMIDEAGTTKEAETIAHVGESIDSVAAGVLGEDFIRQVERGKIDGFTL